MNKFNFVRDGERKLPPGFRFEPTEEEIVFQYLARKIFSCPLPASVIPEIDTIFSFHPSELPGDSEQPRYFFANRELKHPRNNLVNPRRSCAGFWKVTGSDKQITCSKKMPIIGIKKTLVFFKGKHPYATRTDWFMHVYCIALSGNAPTCNIHYKKHFQGSLNQEGKWVLCHVFSKKMMIKSEVYGNGRQQRCGDFRRGDTSDTDSSSLSSSSSDSYDSDSSVLSEVSSSTDSETTDV